MWEQQSSKVSAFSFCFQPGSLTILHLDGCTQELHLRWGNGRHLFTRLQFLLRHHVEQVKTTLKLYLLPSNFSPQIIKLRINLYDNSWFKDSLEAFFPCAIQSVLIHTCLVAQSCLTLWTVACQTPLSMGFSRQEYWNGLPFPLPGDLPDPGIEPVSPALQWILSQLSHRGSPFYAQ